MSQKADLFVRKQEEKKLEDSYTKWRRLYLFEKNSTLLVARALVDIKNIIMVFLRVLISYLLRKNISNN